MFWLKSLLFSDFIQKLFFLLKYKLFNVSIRAVVFAAVFDGVILFVFWDW